MSTKTECSMPICEDAVHARGLCERHYKRWLRHGNPYTKREPKCSTCLQVTRILRRSSEGPRDDLEKFTDLYLLYQTGSPYRLRQLDERGREYDLEDELKVQHAR